MGRLVHTHSTYVEGLIEVLKELRKDDCIKTITPGVIVRVKGHTDKLKIKATREVRGGFKMVARKGSQSEPQLISGGSSVATDTFQTDREALEARNKRDSRGKFLYETDSKYRAWYDKTLGRSDVFG